MATIFDNSTTRPVGYVNSAGQIIPHSFEDLAFQGVYDGNNNLIYKGLARPGALTTAQVWQIAKLTYDGNNNLLTIIWPINQVGANSNDYEFIWANYLTYTYS
jgi:hypothetical protein